MYIIVPHKQGRDTWPELILSRARNDRTSNRTSGYAFLRSNGVSHVQQPPNIGELFSSCHTLSQVVQCQVLFFVRNTSLNKNFFAR